MIGIICAMQEEIVGIEDMMERIKEKHISNMNFKEGILFDKKCVIVRSGVGKVHAAMCAQTMILNYNPDFILNIGTAGSINANVKPYDMVIARNVVQYDYDISAFGDKKRGEISGLQLCEIPCDDNLINIAQKAIKNLKINLHIGNILTGDQFVNNREKIDDIRKEFNGLACEMESGSIGQVCYVNNLAFLALKMISDNADKTSEIDFKDFLVKYPHIIKEIIKNLMIKL